MPLTWTLAFVSLVMGQSAPTAPGAPSAPAEAGNSEFASTFFGSNSSIKTRQIVLCRSEGEYLQMLSDHEGNPEPTPLNFEPNFEKHMVLGIFMGETTNSHGIRFVSFDNAQNTHRIAIRSMSYQTMGDGVAGQAWGIAVINKSLSPIQIDLDIQGIIGGDPKWKTIARLDPRSNRVKVKF
ncbi:MAG: hypothetical protein JST40_11955 [Armatimonadetes bacterium]|nr:hypothetical protein [Armatimonadota bacterium]